MKPQPSTELQHDGDTALPAHPCLGRAAAVSMVCRCPLLSQVGLAGLVTPRARGMTLLVPCRLKLGNWD